MKKGPLILVGALIFTIVMSILLRNVIMTAVSGVTVMSISDAKIISSVPELDYEDAFLIDVVVNRGGEHLVGEFNPEDVARYGTKFVPNGTFKIYIDLINVSCNNRILDDNFLIYKIYQASVRNGLCWGNCKGSCLSSPCPYDKIDLNTVKKACKGEWGAKTRHYWRDDIVHYPEYCGKVFAPMGADTPAPGAPPAGGNCDSIVEIQPTPIRPELGMEPGEWCYAMPPSFRYDNNHWVVTHIAGLPWYRGYKIDTVTTVDYVINITIENQNGETSSAILTPQQSVAFLDGIGRVKFVGSLLAQQFCPVPSVDKAIVKDLGTGEMKVVNKLNYDHYKMTFLELINLDNNYFRYENVDPGVGADVLWEKMSTLNSELRYMYGTQINDSCEIVNGVYRCKPEKDVVYPELQLLIKAKWVGVYLPSGRPKIVDVKVPSETYEGDINRVVAVIQNLANESDSFDVALKCDVPLSLASTRTTLDAHEQKEIYISYSGTKGLYNCSLVVTSVNNPLMSDSKDVQIKIIEKPLPKPPVCENVPPQPCDKAIWQGYPICKWDTSQCEEKPSRWWIWVIVAVVIIGIFAFLIKKGYIKIGKS